MAITFVGFYRPAGGSSEADLTALRQTDSPLDGRVSIRPVPNQRDLTCLGHRHPLGPDVVEALQGDVRGNTPSAFGQTIDLVPEWVFSVYDDLRALSQDAIRRHVGDQHEHAQIAHWSSPSMPSSSLRTSVISSAISCDPVTSNTHSGRSAFVLTSSTLWPRRPR